MPQGKLLIRPHLQKGESLSSLIQRAAEMNGVQSHVIWRYFHYSNTHYPQTSFSHLINICPLNVFNLDAFADSLNVLNPTLESATFIPAIKKYVTNQWVLSTSQRFLSGLLLNYIRFCPVCLLQNRYYRLLWHVKEISVCNEHNTTLVDRCPCCNKIVPSLMPNSIVGICPSCGFKLYNADRSTCYLNSKTLRIFEDWNYLINRKQLPLTKAVGGLDEKQYLAIKLLHIASAFSEKFSKDELNRSDLRQIRLNTMLQIARGSSSDDRYVHLNTVLEVLRSANISFVEFAQMTPPESFIESLLDKPQILSERHFCIAPWCSSYNIPGSLQRAVTSTKKKADGTHLNYYLFCVCCGTKYAIGHETGNLVERGYFIGLAWNAVRPLDLEDYSLNQIAKLINTSRDKVLRCVIFLYANGLIPKPGKLQLPDQPDQETISNYIHYLDAGLKVKEVWKKLSLTYNEFLYYSFLPEVYLFSVSNAEKKEWKPAENRDWINQLESVLSVLWQSNEPITIKRVCTVLNVCPETLRLRGLLPRISEAKKKQKAQFLLQQSTNLKQNADSIIYDLEKNHIEVTSEVVYQRLGVNRTSVVRTLPDVTKYIGVAVKAAKQRQKPLYKSK